MCLIINLPIQGSPTNLPSYCTVPYTSVRRLALYTMCISKIGPYVGIRDTQMLFCFFAASCMFAKGRAIVLDSEQAPIPLRTAMVATVVMAVMLDALLDTVYLLCVNVDLCSPVRAGISKLLIFFSYAF